MTSTTVWYRFRLSVRLMDGLDLTVDIPVFSDTLNTTI